MDRTQKKVQGGGKKHKNGLTLAAALAISFTLLCLQMPVSAKIVEGDIIIITDDNDSELIPDIDSDTNTGGVVEIEGRSGLGQPQDVVLTAVKNGIQLTWTGVQGAQTYEIYRKIAGTDSYTKLRTVKKNAYVDKTAAYGVTYAYKVRAVTKTDGVLNKSKCSKAKKTVTYHIDSTKPMVALTFDDGPSQYTVRILDQLEKYDSRATFFEMGNRVASYPKTVQRIAKMGCELGNHSYDHPSLGSAAVSSIKSQISTTDNNIKKLTGITPKLFRPPYGSVGTNLKNNAKKPLILWSVDTLDWKSRNATQVYDHVMSHVSDGDIILMHDLYESTASAAEQLIPKLIEKGYQLVTVSELAQYKEVKLTAGMTYFSAK